MAANDEELPPSVLGTLEQYVGRRARDAAGRAVLMAAVDAAGRTTTHARWPTLRPLATRAWCGACGVAYRRHARAESPARGAVGLGTGARRAWWRG
jgi:hypothetical protein